MTVTILQGDVRKTLRDLSDERFHCCVTSPPYFALRSYLKPDDPLKARELGSETAPEAYLGNLVSVFSEVRRVLRDDGLLWVNISDSCAAGGMGGHAKGDTFHGHNTREGDRIPKSAPPGLKSLDRVGIPERFALAMQQAGWIWRDALVWSKASCMPENINGTRWQRCRVRVASGKYLRQEMCEKGFVQTPPNEPENAAEWQDCPGCPKCLPNGGYVLRRGSWRTTRSHEYIFLFAKSPGYFADATAVAEDCAATTLEREKYTRVLDDPDEQFAVHHDHESLSGGKRNPRSVRVFKIENLHEKHYAAYPTELPAFAIAASTSSKGCCPTCGCQWAPVVENTPMVIRRSGRGEAIFGNAHSTASSGTMVSPAEVKLLGYRPTCSCPPHDPVRPCVLDPFGGSGSTAIAAAKLGCDCTLCELNPEYVEMARKRIGKTVGLFA
jgi:DNA modification methylase